MRHMQEIMSSVFFFYFVFLYVMYANFALNFGMFHTDFNCSSDLDRNIHVIQPYKTEIFDQNLTRQNSS